MDRHHPSKGGGRSRSQPPPHPRGGGAVVEGRTVLPGVGGGDHVVGCINIRTCGPGLCRRGIGMSASYVASGTIWRRSCVGLSRRCVCMAGIASCRTVAVRKCAIAAALESGLKEGVCEHFGSARPIRSKLCVYGVCFRCTSPLLRRLCGRLCGHVCQLS